MREEVGYRDTIAFENVNFKVRLILFTFLPTPQHEIVKPKVSITLPPPIVNPRMIIKC